MIQSLHNNMKIRSLKFLNQVVSGRKKIFKEHLLPTIDHLKKIESIKPKIVILLRNTDHSLDYYRRFKITNFNCDLNKVGTSVDIPQAEVPIGRIDFLQRAQHARQ